MKKLKLTLAFLLMALPLMMAPSIASACHGKWRSCCCYHSCQYKHDRALVNSVVSRLKDNISTVDQPIVVSARGHKVYLSGRAGTVMQRQVAIDIARWTCGVSLVVDGINVD